MTPPASSQAGGGTEKRLLFFGNPIGYSMTASIDDLRAGIAARLSIANQVATDIKLSAKSAELIENAESIAEISRFNCLRMGFGCKVWAAVLFVDLRNSSRRADDFGPRDTYLTMHGFLFAMAYAVRNTGGHIVGFRGDGLFAAFGIDHTGQNHDDLNHGAEVGNAVSCAKAMLESVDEALQPELDAYGVEGQLQIGVGIDANEIVITRIGLTIASEVTAYGSAVNKASKMSCGNGVVLISPGARELYPTSKDGRMGFRSHSSNLGYEVVYPGDFRVMASSQPALR